MLLAACLPARLQRGFTSGESRLAFEVRDALVRLELLGTLYSFCRQAIQQATGGMLLCKVECCCGGGVAIVVEGGFLCLFLPIVAGPGPYFSTSQWEEMPLDLQPLILP